MHSILSSTVFFNLNRNQEKTEFDKIILRKHRDEDETQFTVEYSDATSTKAAHITLNDSHALLDYMEDILDLMIHDKDNNPFVSIDVMIPGYPVVLLKPGTDDRILLHVLRNWCKRT